MIRVYGAFLAAFKHFMKACSTEMGSVQMVVAVHNTRGKVLPLLCCQIKLTPHIILTFPCRVRGAAAPSDSTSIGFFCAEKAAIDVTPFDLVLMPRKIARTGRDEALAWMHEVS